VVHPHFPPRLPPIVQAFWLDGSGRVEVALPLDGLGDFEIHHARLEHRTLVIEVDFETRFMRANEITMPPARGMAPPLNPVPAPRPTIGRL